VTSRERAGLMVRRAIDMSGMSQAEVAKRMGISKSYVSKLASGNFNMTVQSLFSLVEACGLAVVELRVKKRGGDAT
jgi:transcriptional regulator with XRE-family HTH domain